MFSRTFVHSVSLFVPFSVRLCFVARQQPLNKPLYQHSSYCINKPTHYCTKRSVWYLQALSQCCSVVVSNRVAACCHFPSLVESKIILSKINSFFWSKLFLKSQQVHLVIYGVWLSCMYKITQIHTLGELVKLCNAMNEEFNVCTCTNINSFSSLSHDRSKASSTASSPHSAI
jgi:hypothetical protein